MGTSMNAIDKRNGIVKGSLADIAMASGQSLAETFVGAEVVVIVDTSGSMGTHDSRGGKTRYDVACEELAALQEQAAGRVAVLSFSNDTMFCPTGQPWNFQGGTDMAGALRFAKMADVPGIRFVLISDGEPDNPEATLKVAARYQNRIDTIFVGPEERPAGRDFLQRLAQASGGQQVTADRAVGLLGATQKLLATA